MFQGPLRPTREAAGPLVDDGVLVDHARDERSLPFTVWRPRDTAGAPLVVYSHASYGHRMQSSFLCTRLASDGYIVAAVDHTGNTRAEWNVAPPRARTEEERAAYVGMVIADRVPDISFLIDEMLARYPIARDRIGVLGWSFGGWAVLATPEQDDRVSSIVALSPAGARDPLPGIIPARLNFVWPRAIPTLILAAERDQFISLDRVRDVFDRAPEPKELFVLEGADHGHFADDVPTTGPSAAVAHEFTRAHALAHFQRTLPVNI